MYIGRLSRGVFSFEKNNFIKPIKRLREQIGIHDISYNENQEID